MIKFPEKHQTSLSSDWIQILNVQTDKLWKRAFVICDERQTQETRTQREISNFSHGLNSIEHWAAWEDCAALSEQVQLPEQKWNQWTDILVFQILWMVQSELRMCLKFSSLIKTCQKCSVSCLIDSRGYACSCSSEQQRCIFLPVIFKTNLLIKVQNMLTSCCVDLFLLGSIPNKDLEISVAASQ